MKAEITLKKVVYEIPGMDQLIMLPAVEYRRGEPGPLTMDLSDDSEESKAVIRAILAFLNANLWRSRSQQIS